MSRGQGSFNIIVCFDFPGGSFVAKDTSAKNFLGRRKLQIRSREGREVCGSGMNYQGLPL